MRSLPQASEILAAIGGNDDAIARRLEKDYGIETGQSVMNRWRNGREPNSFRVTVALLDLAGWLNLSPAMPDETLARQVEALRTKVEQVEAALDALQADRTEQGASLSNRISALERESSARRTGDADS